MSLLRWLVVVMEMILVELKVVGYEGMVLEFV